MEKTRDWILVIGVLLILGLGVFVAISVLVTLKNTAEQAVAPVNALGTQAAEILNPTPTILPDPQTIVHDVRSLARLETIQYTIEKVVTAETGGGELEFLFGDRLLFVAHGEVIAGVDLAELDSEDMWVENDTLYVRLPAAEIFVATLDNDKSYVYDRDTGIFNKGDQNLETNARQVAEEEIRKAALEDGILEQAQTNAENYLLRLLLDLGYPRVIFVESEE
ncbi:MAG: DUF4230 domain-containing protein [Anaerolineales bacterium]|nr:DUF4230 domain-containing protein [Anaerolineales bacterium]